MQLSDILAGGTQMAPSVLPPLGQMPGAPMPPLQMAQQMQAAPIAQQQAPVIDKGVPAQPPMPQAAPQQPQAPQAPQGNPEWAARWQAIQQKLADPTVMGPLQTFFGVLSAPMGPGENAGSRMARASMMMRSHQQMLIENQKAQETADQDRQMKLEDRSLAREEKQVNIKRIGGEITEREQSMAPKLATALQTAEKLRLEVENMPAKQESDLKDAENMRAYRNRLPQAAGASAGGTREAKKSQLIKQYDATVKNPLQAWINKTYAADKNADISFDAFLQTDEGALAKRWVTEAMDNGVPLKTIKVGGSGAPAKKSYKLGADGKLQ